MYNSDFICTYQLIQEPDLSDDLYRCQFLQACNLNEWEGDSILNIITYLESLIKTDTNFYNSIQPHNGDNSFMFLLAYPYFHITHRCICDILHDGKVTDKHLNSLLNELNKK